MSTTKIETVRLHSMAWDTTLLVNEHDRQRAYGMSIPARPQRDGTSLDWVMRYGKPTRAQILSALSIMGSYQYLLSSDIPAEEAINRLRHLRRAYQNQPEPKPAT